MMPARSLRRYVSLSFGLAAVLFVVTVGVNIAIDPYGLYHGARWAGINAKKPEAYRHAKKTKRTLAERVSPNAVLLGNSRMDIGFDPESPEWPNRLRPVFNLAVPGQGPSGDLKNLRKVFRDRTPKFALVGVEFLDYLHDFDRVRRARSREPNPNHGLIDSLVDFSRTAASISALGDSLATFVQQSDPYAGNMTRLGFNTLRTYLGHVRREGHHSIFEQRNRLNIRKFVHKPKAVVDAVGRISPKFDHLRNLLRWCRDNGVEVNLVIYPYHHDVLEGIWWTGLWPAFEDWKRVLATIVAAERRNRSGPSVTLWDFSGYHAFATEAVPEKGDTETHMTWYWEAGHFKAALGEIMLRRILHSHGNDRFGVQLTTENVETVILRLRRGRQAYLANRPDAGSHIRRFVGRYTNR